LADDEVVRLDAEQDECQPDGGPEQPVDGVGPPIARGDDARLWRRHYGVDGGGTRFFVACSNAYASSMSRGSLHAVPVKPMPNGGGLGSKPPGNGGLGALGTVPNGTTMIG